MNRGASGRLRQGFLIPLCIALAASLGLQEPAGARDVRTLLTPGGISLWLVEEDGLPIVVLGFAIRGGSSEDPPGKEGLGHMLAAMLEEGAGPLDADGYKERLDALGARLSFSVSRRALSGQLVAIRRQLAPSAELMRLALQEPPHLDEGDFERVKHQEIARASRRDSSPVTFAVRAFYETAFAGHLYARPEIGTQETLSRLSALDVASQRGTLLHRGGLHVVMVGALNAAEASATADSIFGHLPLSEALPATPQTAPRTVSATVSMPGGSPLETAIFALPAPGLDETDYYAALALHQIVGSGNFDARLTQEVRIKRGLSYSISTSLAADSVTSLALGTVSTAPGRIDEALAATRAVFADMQRNGPTAAELENAKSSLDGSYLLSLGTSTELAGHLLALWVDGLRPDYDRSRKERLEAVTLEDARRVAREIFDPAAMSVLVVRPASVGGE